MRFWFKLLLIHCIACVCVTAVQAQGSRPISVRDAQRWQELQGQVEAAFAKGDYGPAEALASQAVTSGSSGFGAVDPNVATNWSSLGSARLRNNKLTGAENNFRQALTSYEKRLGADHQFTGAMLNNLGLVLLQGKFKDAKAVFRRVMVSREKVLGPEHPDTAISLNNVANALFEQAKQDDANGPPTRRARGAVREFAQASETETLYRRALAVQEKTIGEAHPSTAATLNNLAVLLSGRGRYAEAEPMHARALAIAEKSLGPSHLDTAGMRTTLAITFDRQGKSTEAEALGSAQKTLVSTVYQSEGRAFSRAHPFFWAPFVVVGN